jgi:zona occludens toxin
MLVYNQGVPGAGKSYDAVKNHIVPALKAGRHVFARLNGADESDKRDAMAAYCGLTRERLDELYHHVPTNEVVATFIAEQSEGDDWLPVEQLRNALVVIDECHQFYVSSKDPLPQEQEEFFAMARHTGTDVVLMTQFYKRMHTALRFRIERKNSFQKLSAVGLKNRYTQRAYVTLEPDKYELIGTTTHSYDSAVFPTYKGVAGDDVQTDVYEGGAVTVWKKLLIPAVVVIPLAIWGIFKVVGFFGGGAHFTKGGHAAPSTTSAQQAPGAKVDTAGGFYQPDPAASASASKAPPPTAQQIAEAKKEKLLEAMTPEQRYVWALGDTSRIRYGGAIGTGQSARGIVEWINGSSVVIERLELSQLRAMGIGVDVLPFGVRLTARDATLVATAWPLNVPLRDERPELYNTSGAHGARASAASPSAIAPGSSPPGALIGAPPIPPTASFSGGA